MYSSAANSLELNSSGLSFTEERQADAVYMQLADDDFRVGIAVTAADQRADTRFQFVQCNGFDHIIVSTEVKQAHTFVDCLPG